MSVPELSSLFKLSVPGKRYKLSLHFICKFSSVSKMNEDMQFLFFLNISFRFMLCLADNAISEGYGVIYINGPVYQCL